MKMKVAEKKRRSLACMMRGHEDCPAVEWARAQGSDDVEAWICNCRCHKRKLPGTKPKRRTK